MTKKDKEEKSTRTVKFNHSGKLLCETEMSSQLALDMGFHHEKKYYKISEVISQEECSVNEVDEKTGRVIE